MLGNTICECRFFGEWVGLSHYTFPIIRSSYQCSQSENSSQKTGFLPQGFEVFVSTGVHHNVPLHEQTPA